MKYHLRGLLQLIIPFLLIMVRFIRSARAKIKYFGCWHEKEKFGMSKRNKILILCHTGGIQEVIDPITKRHSKSNVMVKDVIKELKKNLNNEVIAVQGHYKDRSVPEMDPPYIFFDNYINLSIYLKTLREALSLIKKWQKLKNNKNFKYSLKYKNIPLWELLNYKFSNLFSADLVLAILTIETVKRIINIEKPDAIVMTYETGYYGKAAIIEGKRRGIPTLGMQHGIIHPYHPDYMYGEEEVSNDGVISPLYCPFPDKLAVYGEYVKNVLTKYSAYPQDRIVITGQPRYDILAEIEKFSDKKNTCKRLNLDQNKKNIVLATQGFQSKYGLPDYDKTLFNAVFNALKDFSETQLIIKLHPKEDGELQRKMVSERGLKNVIITKGELYEILYICDILITFTSTVAIEALILDKTVIIVNLAGVPDPMPYVESGAAIGIYKEEDLAIAIRKALYDKETKEELRRARKKFVYEHTYRQDGRATERVADLIIQMIEESKRRKE